MCLSIANSPSKNHFRKPPSKISCFTGFGGGTKIIRGGKEDKWNSVCASCATGAYLARKRGPAEMAKGCAGYAGITLLFENMGAGGKKSSEEGEVVRNVME